MRAPGASSTRENGSSISRNAGNGFDFFVMNARLSRTFSLGQRWKLEAMAEVFNP
jgi:hypothetical protein